MNPDFEKALSQLCGSHLGRRSFLTALSVLFFACSSGQKQNSNSEWTLVEEKQLGREAFLKMRRDYPAYKDEEVQSYISNLGAQLVRANDLEGKPYEYSFTVVDVPSVNAFALPAGKVFVTAPLLAAVETEAELAGVLSHEIGHISARHAARRIRAEQDSRSESWMYGTGGVVAGGLIGGVSASVLCPGNNSACLQQMIAMAAAFGARTGLLVQKYRFLAHNQENELEADRLGFEISKKAGYSIHHVGDFYRRQLQAGSASKTNQIPVELVLIDSMSTHPPSLERVRQIEGLSVGVVHPLYGVVSTTAFDKIRKRMASLRAH